jgi:hypothetical protein
MKTPEIPYDETADDQRREIDRLEIARQELADREARLLQQQLEAERRIAEANSRAEETLRRADKILEEAEAAAENTDYDSSGRYASGYYPYYPYGYGPGYYSSGYYRKHGGIYYKSVILAGARIRKVLAILTENTASAGNPPSTTAADSKVGAYPTDRGSRCFVAGMGASDCFAGSWIGVEMAG